MSMGRRIPVDSLAPKIKTSIATMITLIPFIPDFDKPKIKDAKAKIES